MESNDLVLYETIKGIGEQVSDETAGRHSAKKIVNAVHAIYYDKAKENATKQDNLDLKMHITEITHESEEKQSDRFRYVYEKMADYHKTTLTWLVATAIAVIGLVVGLIKLL